MDTDNRLAITVDVEDWYHVPAVTGSSFSEYEDVDAFFADWDREYDYLTEPTHRLLDLFDRSDVRATFFVVADVVENYPGLVEEIAARGHEIGCHGRHHACAVDPDTKEPRFDRREYERRIRDARERLADATGRDVVGFRAPGAYVGGWVLDVLEDLSFRYDSSVSVNSLYNKTDSDLARVTSEPYVPERGRLTPGGDRDLVEFPWPYYEVAGVKLPTAGGPFLRFLGSVPIRKGLRQSLRRGDTLFYVHPLDIARESFPVVGNSRRRPAYWSFAGRTTERRLRTVLASFKEDRLATLSELDERARRGESAAVPPGVGR